MNPTVRRTDLLVEQIGDELVVYDRKFQLAHRLNSTAAMVFQQADGTATAPQLAVRIEQELGASNGGDLLQLALHQLRSAHLLVEGQGLSRGQKTLLAGAGIALMVPVVETLLAPEAAAAFSF